LAINLDGVKRSAHDLLSYTGVSVEKLTAVWPELREISPAIARQLEIEAAYAGYLRRQDADIRAFRRDEALEIPADLDFGHIAGLSTEARNKLDQARPATLAAAARISGVTPAALTALLGYVRRREPNPPLSDH
jgi:tRNA uridine 5-carboxymethylaminomethyl modification enzyme